MHTSTANSETTLRELTIRVRSDEDGSWPALLWKPSSVRRMATSALLGGGIGDRHWVLNAQVTPGYRRVDAAAHLADIASEFGAVGPGVGLMTAASVADRCWATDGGVEAVVTAGIGVRGWAADPAPGSAAPAPAGTINILVSLPVALTDAALVNAIATATEAKVQALLSIGVHASGTPTDAVCVAGLPPTAHEPAEPFAGPRSLWGARLARAVFQATASACERAEHHRR